MMGRNHPNIKNRRSIRIPDYNYAQEGMYFITLCAHQKKCIFGHIEDDVVHLNQLGKVIERSWHAIPKHFPHVCMDAFVIMPNHLHGIVNFVHTSHNRLGVNARANGTSKSLGSVVRCLKVCVTKWAKTNSMNVEIWQRNYYEHVIRDERDYIKIAEYVQNNPLRWRDDSMYQE